MTSEFTHPANIISQEKCDGPNKQVPEGKSPGQAILIVDLAGGMERKVYGCDNRTPKGMCRLSPKEKCGIESGAIIPTGNIRLYW